MSFQSGILLKMQNTICHSLSTAAKISVFAHVVLTAPGETIGSLHHLLPILSALKLSYWSEHRVRVRLVWIRS